MSKPNRMALQTYGDKPTSFQLVENGEYYCIGAEVAKYLGIRGYQLYRKYPQMYRKPATRDEKKQLVLLNHLHPCVPMAYVYLVRASEIEDIIEGNDYKYKTASNHSTEPLPRRKRKYRRSMPSATKSSHLDALLPAGQINRKRLHDEKVRTLSQCCEDRNLLPNMKTAEQQVISMPWSLDEETEEPRLGDISISNNIEKRVSTEDQMEEEKTETTENSSQLEAALNQKCRLCLKTHDQFSELFGSDGVLPLKIMALASVKIERGDGLPSVICVSCRQLLDIFHNFKCLVEKSDTALRALLIDSSLSTEMKINHNAGKESLARSVKKDFVMQYESQLLPPQNIDHMATNDYNSRQDSVAREINKKCMNGNNHLHKKGLKDKNKDNELDIEKLAEKDDNPNEAEIIIYRINRSEILLKDALDDGVSVSQSLQSMESEPIEQEQLLLPTEIDLTEEEDNHYNHQANQIIFHGDSPKNQLKYNSISGREYKANDVSSEPNDLETAKCRASIGRITDNDNDIPLNSEFSEQKYSNCIGNFPINLESPSHDTIHENTPELRYTCYWCEKQFSDIAELIDHVTNNHDSSNNRNKADINNNNYGRGQTGDKVATLNKNTDSPNSEQIFRKKGCKSKCKVCAKQFSYQKSFLSHIETHPEYKRSRTSDDYSGGLEKTRILETFQ